MRIGFRLSVKIGKKIGQSIPNTILYLAEVSYTY